MSETIRTCEWFPTAARLLECGYGAPPPPSKGLLPTARCERCDGIGFEMVDREIRPGYTMPYAQPCVCRPVPVAK